MKSLAIIAFFCVALQANNAFNEAGRYFGIDPRLLWAIAKKESNHNPKAIGKANKNSTYDIGIMQINSSYIPMLSKEFAITKKDLLKPRVNIFVGAMILRKCLDKHGLNANGITCYNGRIKNNPYGKEVLAILATEQKSYEKRMFSKLLKERNIK